MIETPTSSPASAGFSPRPSGRLFFSAMVAVLLVALCLPVSAGPHDSVHTFSLLPGLEARIADDGSLHLVLGSDATPFLATEILPVIDSRRSRNARHVEAFTRVVAEGAPGGQRGFSQNRDDDQDGLVDEDPLDGVDNDGDGRVDEDFAAIGEAMVVIHQDGRQVGGRAAHLEYYHWAYPRLRSTVFLNAGSNPDAGSEATYRMSLATEQWFEATATATHHSLAGKPETSQTNAFVTRIDGAADCGEQLWLGVVVLAEPGDFRARLDHDVLELDLADRALPVAICAAESRSRLNYSLNEAVRVYRGLTDKLTGQQASWIVPPLCTHCRLGDTPEFYWSRNSSGDLQVTARIEAGCVGALDPDLFKVAGIALGAPSEIRWQPDTGAVVAAPWICRNSGMLNSSRAATVLPYAEMPGLTDHRGAGRLTFTFAASRNTSLAASTDIAGVYLDGRMLAAPLLAALEANENEISLAQAGALAEPRESISPQPDQGRVLRTSDTQPALSPKLLEGFPNPFRDMIQLRFTVPATMAEAFVWEKDKAAPAGLDLDASVPWKTGTPQVSVKIYSINGQELVNLFSGSRGPGETLVRWSGTDNFGRQVASGTYFCKLQMDNWSVTRRIVFLR